MKSMQRKFYDKRYSFLQRALHKLQNSLVFFYDTRLIERILRISNVASVNSILEVGCGQGTDTILISRHTHQIVAIDVSLPALKVARTLSRMKAESEKISFVVSDAQCLPLRDDLFDVVFCKDLLHHVPHPKSTLSEMKRVAKEGGKVIAIEANACNPQMILIGLIYLSVDKGVFKNTKTRLIATFKAAGLSDVGAEETEFLPRHLLFEYRSPLCRLPFLSSMPFSRTIHKIENNMQNLSIVKRFANYIIVRGVKKSTASSDEFT